MSSSSGILMSSNFYFDLNGGGGGKAASFGGVHPGIFRTPASPSVSSSLYLADSTPSLQYGPSTPSSNFKRKRVGGRDLTPAADWPMTNDAHFNPDQVMEDRLSLRSDFDLKTTDRDRRYVLAGLIGTPDHAAQRELGNFEDSIHSDIDYRRALGSKRLRHDSDDHSSGPQAANAKPRTSSGWSSFAINTIGGVVGKVWQFCKAGAFRGFYAGGGAGYEMAGSTTQTTTHNRGWGVGQDMSMSPDGERDAAPYYGDLPPSDYSPYHYERETPETTPPPAAKRRQISYGKPADELGKNWVMVADAVETSRPASQASRASSRLPVQRPTVPSLPRRFSKPAGRLSAPVFNRHPPERSRVAVSGLVPAREPASFASARSPMASPAVKIPTPSRIPIPSRPQSPSTFALSQPSRIPSPSPYATKRGGGHRRSQSAISASSASSVKIAAKRDSLLELQDNSPRLDAKARSLAAKRMKEEMETDLRISDFNARLKDMIRQGREALGTTYEVELDDAGVVVDGDGRGDPWESE
ncbi:hypothetical protein F5Y17DRAFT_410729 [Xylariaceae sp. FL0594]|nr:hypothetical protein F5Y17DRAFT_410729 [Xylariaceae sp. FL0594]